MALGAVTGNPASAATSSGTGKAASSSSSSAASSSSSPSALTQDQASAKARKTGKPVQVTSATTATSTLTANANGTFTLSQATAPVRKKVGSSWENLDATLVRGRDGSISPKTTDGALTLSGGGTGALATLHYGVRSLTLSLPSSIPSLPAPTLAGDTATYANVLPGVNLVVTADDQGGFSEVFEVENAKAAANPALDSLTFTTRTRGLTVHADAAGNLTAATPSGAVLFSAPAATMWDSTTAGGTVAARAVVNPTTGAKVDARTGRALASSPTAPGEGAHTTSLKARYSGSALTLTPDTAALRGTKVAYPVYIDPTWTFNAPSSAGTEQAHTYVTSVYPTTSYWNTTNVTQVGYTDWVSSYVGVSRSYYREGLSSALYGATVISSTFYVTEEWSASCSARTVDLYQTGVISSSTTWDTKPSDNTLLASADVAHGYSSSCSAASVPFSITSEMQTAATGDWSNITLGLVAADETDDYAWKEFSDTSTLTTTFDKAPSVGAMSTSPQTSCSSVKTVGLGPVTLYAEVSSPEGTQNPLGVAFQLWKTSVGSGTLVASTDINSYTASSGTTASYQVSQSALSTAAGGSATEFSWYVRTWDGYMSSAWSSVCNFTYDPTTPGQPVVTGSSTGQVGVSQSFTLAAGSCPSSTTCVPSSYIYQLNGQQPQTVTATSGDATISIKPTRRTNVLTVTGQSGGGNLGDPSTSIINASAATTPAADKDVANGGSPDVLNVGQSEIASSTFADASSGNSKTGYTTIADTGSSIPAGLWLARGTGTSGSVTATASDIGINGNGFSNDYKPSDFTGYQALTGRFYGDSYQDVLVYNPTTGIVAAIRGSGDGSALPTVYSGNALTPTSGSLNDTANGNGDNPLQLAAAYNASGGSNSTAYPDLIGINGDGSNYYLDYYTAKGTATWNAAEEVVADPTASSPVALSTPDDTADWNNWVISSTQVTDTTSCTTASPCDDMLLWKPSAGLLYLWTDLAYATGGNGTGKLTYTSTNLSASALFDQGVTLAGLEIADFAGTGTPGIWATTPDGKTTAYPVTISSSGTATLGNLASSAATSSHSWSLADYSSSTAADNTVGTALPLTGTSGATVNTGDLFQQDVELSGASSGRLYSSTSTTSGGALTLTSSFTVSFWADPTSLGGIVVSQDGTADSGIEIWPNTGGTWSFALNTTSGTADTWDTISGGTVQLEDWAHITATYDASTKVMNLYVDGTFVATGSHTAPSAGATGAFQIGDSYNSSTRHYYFTGDVARVETISGQAITPNQPSAASYHQAITPERILDTRSTTGDTLTENTTSASTPVAADSTTVLQIVGDTVTPVVTGAPTTIPASATAVAVDITVASETSVGDIITYADGTQRPVTSTTNYAASTNTTGYQVVPIGADGAIAFYNQSTGTTHLIIDITGYYTSDATLTGDQTYHPLSTAYRFFDTRTSAGRTNTSLTTSPVAANSTFTATITGVDGVPSTATAVAVNITAANQTGPGVIEAYQAGTTEPTDTTLTYLGTATASLNADIPLGTATGYVGKIAVNNIGTHTTDVIGDVAGYYTTDTSGEVYHAVNPTRLVDTRSGIGGYTGTIAAYGTYTLSSNSTALVTTATTATPTLALQLTTTSEAINGDLIAYPAGATRPTTSNLNWTTSQTIANLALTTTSSSGAISIYNESDGTLDLIVDCSGYFASS